MHPMLCAFPAAAFYGGQLQTSTSVPAQLVALEFRGTAQEMVLEEDVESVVLVESDAEIVGVFPSVLCVGVDSESNRTEHLLDLLSKHQISSILDARVQPERSVSQLRRGCAARGLGFEWSPALSSRGAGAAAGDRAAAVLRLAAAASWKLS
eukprot:Skav233943  [mRNA]  locus=scaffold1382:69496:74866:+ [translate_table: standard]